MKFSNSYKWVLGLSIFLLALSCREDTFQPALYGKIQGVVINENFDSLNQVILSTNPSTEVITTGKDGIFSFDSIPEGTYTLRARREGYREEVVSVSVQDALTTEVTVVMSDLPNDNFRPAKPSAPVPPDGTSDLSTTVRLSWSGADENTTDTLLYNVVLYWDEHPNGILVSENNPDTTFLLENLAYSTDYYWQVIATDQVNDSVYSEIWHFSTMPFPDFPIRFVRKKDGLYHIFATDGQDNTVQLTNRPESSWRPRMSPTRDKIAFLSFEDFQTHLYTMDPDGKNLKRITTIPVAGYDNFELDFCWSPNGARLLYPNYNKLYLINRDGSGLELLAEAPPERFWVEAEWAAPGNFIAARTRGIAPYQSEIYILKGENGYTPELLLEDLPGSTTGPSISVDGMSVLYSYDVSRFESPSGRQLNAVLIIMDILTKEMVNISVDKEEGTNDLDGRYSPTGAHVIFSNTANDGSGTKSLWTVKTDGSDRTVVLQNAEMPDWR